MTRKSIRKELFLESELHNMFYKDINPFRQKIIITGMIDVIAQPVYDIQELLEEALDENNEET